MANSFYLDASALAKRYVPETGSALVDAILDTIPARRVLVLNVGAGEVVSIFVRKRNAGLLSAADFGQAYADFENEILHAADIKTVSVTNRLAWSSLPLIIAHSINSNDAVLLRSASPLPGDCAAPAKTLSLSPRTSASSAPLKWKGCARSIRKARIRQRWPCSWARRGLADFDGVPGITRYAPA